MRLSSVKTMVVVCLLSAASAGASWYRAEQLRSEAAWLLERGRVQASEYALSFNDVLASQQLESFAQRRAVLERAYLWQRLQTLALLLAAAAAMGAWALSLLGKLRGTLEDAEQDAVKDAVKDSGPPVHPRLQRSRG